MQYCNFADLSPHIRIAFLNELNGIPIRATYPKVGLRLESGLTSKRVQRGRVRETTRTRVELDHTENLNLTSAHQHLETPRVFALLPSLLSSSAYYTIQPPPSTFPHTSASLPPAAATRAHPHQERRSSSGSRLSASLG